jgi:hypothetical protein
MILTAPFNMFPLDASTAYTWVLYHGLSRKQDPLFIEGILGATSAGLITSDILLTLTNFYKLARVLTQSMLQKLYLPIGKFLPTNHLLRQMRSILPKPTPLW